MTIINIIPDKAIRATAIVASTVITCFMFFGCGYVEEAAQETASEVITEKTDEIWEDLNKRQRQIFSESQRQIEQQMEGISEAVRIQTLEEIASMEAKVQGEQDKWRAESEEQLQKIKEEQKSYREQAEAEAVALKAENSRLSENSEQQQVELESLQGRVASFEQTGKRWTKRLKSLFYFLGLLTAIKILGTPLARVVACLILRHFRPEPRQVVAGSQIGT